MPGLQNAFQQMLKQFPNLFIVFPLKRKKSILNQFFLPAKIQIYKLVDDAHVFSMQELLRGLTLRGEPGDCC